ncbi:hypothetical protein IWQ48_003836 [Labrenzia sp. EL_13]|nr:hypothetical protein [Labrenzia sp. EL_195]MBG6202689.1 hypothetical protein [Labrenzia sp. EL_13]
MTHNKKNLDHDATRPDAQPRVAYDRLFNLMLSAQARGQLFIVFDECENEFEHRNVHTLTLAEQRRLYHIARDELSKVRMRNYWQFDFTTSSSVQ